MTIIQKYRKSNVSFFFVSESQDEKKWLDFIQRQRADAIPNLVHLKADGLLRAGLQDRRQPLTLLLDAQNVVRQAFVGALITRRTELTDAIDRLSAAAVSGAAESR